MRRIGSIVAAVLLIAAGAWTAATVVPAPADGAADPVFDAAFWRLWGDGKAELSSYDLAFPRYGASRPGVAVTIWVTETFSNGLRVKADPGQHPESDRFPVMKLNLVQDFPTGIYDYNLMTSVFTALAPAGGLAAGAAAKVAFSAQEWCGTVYQQLVPRGRRVRSVSHSYFDGEADREETLPLPGAGILEDALPAWARGFAGPVLAPGGTRTMQVLRSPEAVRLRHVPLAWDPVTLTRSAGTSRVEVPAGTFDAETWTAEIGGTMPRRWTFLVEAAGPRRIVRWERDDGLRADLVASERTAYWKENGPEFRDAVRGLGLEPRPARTP